MPTISKAPPEPPRLVPVPRLADEYIQALDGRLVPRQVAEAALWQQTAMLVNGLLVGTWPDFS